MKLPLLVSSKGKRVDTDNINDEFRRAVILAFVRTEWPRIETIVEDIEPLEIAHLIYTGRVAGFDGAPPRDPAKLSKRKERVNRIEELAKMVVPFVMLKIDGRPMYALRATHISWARNLSVNSDSVKAQVGHGPQDIEERHYLDPHLVDASESLKVVWEVLNGSRQLRGKRSDGNVPARMAAGAELQQVDLNVDHARAEPKTATRKALAVRLEVVKGEGLNDGGGYRGRLIRFWNSSWRNTLQAQLL